MPALRILANELNSRDEFKNRRRPRQRQEDLLPGH
jgi:hypothetical protein